MFPDFFPGLCVEAINGLGAVRVPECEEPAIADCNRGEPGPDRTFPEPFRSLGRPRGGPAGFLRDAVAVGSAPAGPVVGGGGRPNVGAQNPGGRPGRRNHRNRTGSQTASGVWRATWVEHGCRASPGGTECQTLTRTECSTWRGGGITFCPFKIGLCRGSTIFCPTRWRRVNPSRWG